MSKKILLGFVFFISTVAAQSYLVEIRVDNYLPVRSYLEENGYDVAGYNPQTGELGIVTDNPKSLEQLQSCVPDRLRFSVSAITPTEPFLQYTLRQDGIEGYFDAEKTVEEMQKIERAYPDRARVYNLNQWLDMPPTEEGRNIYALQVSANPDVIEDEIKVMLIGLHHCREVVTHHVVLDAAYDLLEGAKVNPVYRAWLEDSAVWFVPVVNPDGLEYVFNSDRMWRKNRSRNPDGSRGVDLNRNYEFLWGKCGSNSTVGSSDIYRGPKPQSEPEVRVMDRLNDRLGAQFVISYHSYGNEVLYPYRCASLAETQFYYAVRDALAKKLQFGIRYASSSGEDFEQHYHHYGTISFLLELGTSFQPSFSSYRSTIWPNVQKVLPFVLEETHKPHLHLNIVEAGTAKPLAATIAVKEIPFKEGELRRADQNGSYRWYLLPGAYTVTVSMQGYQSETFNISAGKQVEYVVELEK